MAWGSGHFLQEFADRIAGFVFGPGHHSGLTQYNAISEARRQRFRTTLRPNDLTFLPAMDQHETHILESVDAFARITSVCSHWRDGCNVAVSRIRMDCMSRHLKEQRTSLAPLGLGLPVPDTFLVHWYV